MQGIYILCSINSDLIMGREDKLDAHVRHQRLLTEHRNIVLVRSWDDYSTADRVDSSELVGRLTEIYKHVEKSILGTG